VGAAGASPRPGWTTAASLWRNERASFRFALEGLAYCWRTQRHLRVHAGVAVLVVGIGLVVGLQPAEWAVLVAMIALVGALELVNTVIEVVVDLVSPEYHPLAKIAKDVAAGAVLLAAACAVVVGTLILLPPLGTALFPR
jgi:diacylglycerol kinase